MSDTPDVDLVDVIADALAAAGVGVKGATAGTAIVSKELNPSPDRGIALNVSGGPDGDRIASGRRMVQVRTRGTKDTRDVDRLAHQAFRVLHANVLLLGGDLVAYLERTSFVSLGRDGSGRWERSDNYLADITERPDVNRPD